MGIRAICPNGHRLHLKTQLAGRRGLCPDCGARFRIPFESSDVPQPFAEPPNRKKRKATANVADVETVSGVQVAASVGAQAAIEPRSHDQQLGDIPLAMPADESPAIATQPTQQVPATATTTPLSNGDALDEAPHASWYVQPPLGGRYGPANATVLRQWITEGRVTESCLVWRDGWSEWQPASTILGGRNGASADAEADILSVGGRSNLRHRRKGSKGLGVSMIVILSLACILLLVILMVLITTGKISF